MFDKLAQDKVCLKVFFGVSIFFSSVTLLVFSSLLSSIASADTTSVDNINIIIPASCTLNGTNTQHTANINNGTYQSDIGLSTIKAFCNDTEGFAIYAIGYTNEEDGNTVLTSETTNISTGTLTSGNNSQWAMKLATSSGATYPLTLGSDTNGSYANYHVIPSTYTKVAYRNSGTDIGQSAIGATMTSTYQVYISPTQAAGTYVGKVKYLLIHPASISYVSNDYYGVNFVVPDGSGMEFNDGGNLNSVKVRVVCIESDDSNCDIAVVEGEYEQPINYRGAWVVNMGDDSVVLPVKNESEMLSVMKELSYRLDATGLKNTYSVVTAYTGNTIIYDGNGATAGDMSDITSRLNFVNDSQVEANVSVGYTDLISPNFKKDGYGFAGWSVSSTAVPGTDVIFGSNQRITTNDIVFDDSGLETLYAIWVESTGTMQNFSCSSLNVGGVTALTDSRDGNVYTVGRLVDGNCWMMENMRLNGDAILNSSNTDHPAVASLNATTDSWCDNGNDTDCVDQSKVNTNNINIGGSNASGRPLLTINTLSAMDFTSGNDFLSSLQWYSYGNYYNYYAATAGTGTYATASGDATGSICPAGWSLPTGDVGGQFGTLDVALGGTGLSDEQDNNAKGQEMSIKYRQYPNNYIYSGYWNVFGARYRGFFGYYWSKTASVNSGAYRLLLAEKMALPAGNHGDKFYGFAVRCITEP